MHTQPDSHYRHTYRYLSTPLEDCNPLVRAFAQRSLDWVFTAQGQVLRADYIRSLPVDSPPPPVNA